MRAQSYVVIFKKYCNKHGIVLNTQHELMHEAYEKTEKGEREREVTDLKCSTCHSQSKSSTHTVCASHTQVHQSSGILCCGSVNI